MKSRTAAALLAGLGLAGGGATLAATSASARASSPAVVDTTPDTTPDSTTATDATTATDDSAAATDEAATDDATDAPVRPALDAWLADALQPLIDAGTITQEQADAITAAIGEAVPGRPMRAAAISLDVLTGTLGVTAEQLRTAFADGQSIADVAEAQGVDLQTVIDALVVAGTGRIDAAVTDGSLTQEEADARTAALTERVTELVNEPGGPGFGERGRHQMGPGGPIGPGHAGPGGPGGEPGQPPSPDAAPAAPDNAPTTDATAGSTDTTATDA